MSELARLQHIFQQSVLQSCGDNMNSWISTGGRTAPNAQLEVYRHAYRARLKEALAGDYPATQRAIGDERFHLLADDYIDAHPSHYFSLRNFGARLTAFVESQRGSGSNFEPTPWLTELTRFEWALRHSFDAADTNTFKEQDLNDFSSEMWPELRFIFHPSAQFLDMEWNVPEMWQALTGDDPTPVTAERENTTTWLIWRKQLVTQFRSISMEEKQTMELVLSGGSFLEMCEKIAEFMDENEVPVYAAGLLKGWIVQELISDVR